MRSDWGSHPTRSIDRHHWVDLAGIAYNHEPEDKNITVPLGKAAANLVALRLTRSCNGHPLPLVCGVGQRVNQEERFSRTRGAFTIESRSFRTACSATIEAWHEAAAAVSLPP